MFEIPDAPWIRETERTGHCSSGYWNSPPERFEDDYFEKGDDENEQNPLEEDD